MRKGEGRSEASIDHGEMEDSDLESCDEKRQFNKFELLDLMEDGAPEAADSDGSVNSDQDDDAKDGHPKHNEKTNVNQKPVNYKRTRRGKRGGKGKNSNKTTISNKVEEEMGDLAKAIVTRSQTSDNIKSDASRFKLLKVDTRNLIPEAELKRIFGRGVVKEDKTRPRVHPGSNVQRSRFVAASYYETKPSGAFSGPKMELDDFVNFVEDAKSDNPATKIEGTSTSIFTDPDKPVYFKFVHDKPYQEAQCLFIEAVHMGHSEFIVQNITVNPSHAESLVQLSHMIRVSEDYKGASELIERALVVFEKGFHPRFNIATATCRLSYKRPENRTFFITIFKHINCCHRRGLRRTPFEYSKLLLSLEPENDPLMAVQIIDFFAIRSEEYDYLIEFFTKWERLQKLPNLRFSLALAYFLKSRCSKQSKAENEVNLKRADELLQEALLIFPNFIIPLLDACSGEPDAALKQCSYFDYSVYSNKYKLVPETVEVLVNLYVKRSFSLWKQKPVLSWLEKNVAEMVTSFANKSIIDEGKHIRHWSEFPKVVPKNLLRHIVLCDLDIKIPPSASSSTYLDIDPYPPSDAIITYHTRTHQGNPSGSSHDPNVRGSLLEAMSGLFIRSILPSFSMDNPSQSGSTSGSNQTNQTAGGTRQGNRSNASGGQTRANQSGSNDTNLPSQIELIEHLRQRADNPDYINSLIEALELQTPGTDQSDDRGNNEQQHSGSTGNENGNVMRRRQQPR